MPTPRPPAVLVVLAAMLGGGLAWGLFGRTAARGELSRAAAEEVIDALAHRADRTSAEDLQLGKALNAVGREQAALDAFLRAADAGVVDEEVKVFALSAMALTPDARANALLRAWPDRSIEPLLVQTLQLPQPLRGNALSVLVARGMADDAHRRRVALLDLDANEPCSRREAAAAQLEALGSREDRAALDAIPPNDPCLGQRATPIDGGAP